jgi:uncharacterized protein
MSNSPVLINTSIQNLENQSIPSDWVLDGSPETRSKNVVRSHDWMSHSVVWECTAGSFKWHYDKDEVVVVLSGEAFLLRDQGDEQRLGPGDVGYFPAGTSCTWRIPKSIRKVGVLRETTWRPIGFCLKVVNKLFRMIGLKGKSALMFAAALPLLWSCQ